MILQLVSTKCMSILLYGRGVLPIRQSQLRSLDFMIYRLFMIMKLFKTNDIRLVHLCQDLYRFHLPSELLQQRSKNKFVPAHCTLINERVMHVFSYLCFFVIS